MPPKRKPAQKIARKRQMSSPSSSSDDSTTSSTASGSSASTVSGNHLDDNLFIPTKSAKQYNTAFEEFNKHRNSEACPVEQDLLDYVHHLTQKYSWKTLWSKISMLKTMISVKYPTAKINYARVTMYLKRRENDGAGVKKAAVFTVEEVKSFLDNTDLANDTHLLHQAFFTVSYYGGLRNNEAYQLLKSNVSHCDDLGRWVTYTPVKQKGEKKPSVFLIPKGRPCDIFDKYMNSLPLSTTYLWHTPNHGGVGFKKQRWGINSCYKAATAVAGYLKLANPSSYTSHSIRRTSATNMADAGGNINDLMRFFGWRSVATAQGYLDKSKTLLQELSGLLAGTGPTPPATSAVPAKDLLHSTEHDTSLPGFPTTSSFPGLPVSSSGQTPMNVYYFSNIGEGASIQIGGMETAPSSKKPAKKPTGKKSKK